MTLLPTLSKEEGAKSDERFTHELSNLNPLVLGPVSPDRNAAICIAGLISQNCSLPFSEVKFTV